ncbi:hypothetical protein ACFQ1Q_13290 [Winogradskyella litorisediminis]|uniref:MFS transporter n=1 Tax=Winogradskyella litorisediminis TaxID=1156618 RepID=A0ABW3N982_9FLAO
MLGFLLIFLIGREFYRLAEKFEKNKWLFGILGVASYYIGTMLAGGMVGLIMGLTDTEITDEKAKLVGYATIPVGLLVTYIFYKILKPNWEEEYRRNLIREQNKTKVYGVSPIDQEEE